MIKLNDEQVVEMFFCKFEPYIRTTSANKHQDVKYQPLDTTMVNM